MRPSAASVFSTAARADDTSLMPVSMTRASARAFRTSAAVFSSLRRLRATKCEGRNVAQAARL